MYVGCKTNLIWHQHFKCMCVYKKLLHWLKVLDRLRKHAKLAHGKFMRYVSQHIKCIHPPWEITTRLVLMRARFWQIFMNFRIIHFIIICGIWIKHVCIAQLVCWTYIRTCSGLSHFEKSRNITYESWKITYAARFWTSRLKHADKILPLYNVIL